MANLKLFNSLTRKKERFLPGPNNKVGIYVCGITPYGVTHLGHAFTYVFFDVVARYLRHLGYKTTYVQNLTDIDDDILKKSKELKKNWRVVVNENTRQFLNDMRWLNNVQPDVYPKATDHIKYMIEMVKRIIKKKAAYFRNGNVYFEIKKDKGYGSLSGLSKRQMLPIASERGNNPEDPDKKDPLDFVLWQRKKKGEPFWKSPFGAGRPGWHIECSAMAKKYLGPTIDIYGGGHDLIFPHHESSVSQSKFANKKKLARYWVHIAALCYQGKKMSKSLGNLVLISDLKKDFSPNALRLCLLSHHYRSLWDFKKEELILTERTANLFKKVWQLPSGAGKTFKAFGFEKDFFQFLDDDFNAKKAVNVLVKSARQAVREKEEVNFADLKHFFNKAFNILGLVIDYE